jgi:hypothetical protein
LLPYLYAVTENVRSGNAEQALRTGWIDVRAASLVLLLTIGFIGVMTSAAWDGEQTLVGAFSHRTRISSSLSLLSS